MVMLNRRQAAYFAAIRAWWMWWFRIFRWGTLALSVLFIYCAWTLPKREALEKIRPDLSSRVLDREGHDLGEFGRGRRQGLALSQTPPALIDAVISIEDRNFWRHGGVDLGALPAALRPALSGGRARGASTLTQQLAKNVFLGPERSLLRKAKEFLLALRLERIYTKAEILELYLNEVYLGAGAYGFADAAQVYFHRPLENLGIEEMAALAALLRKPEGLRLDKRSHEARRRRDVVLTAMARNGKLTLREADSLAKLPLHLDVQLKPHLDSKLPLVLDRVEEEMDKAFGSGFSDSAGAAIYTSIDLRIQGLADSLLRFHLDTLQRRLDRATLWACNLPGKLRRSEAYVLGHMEESWQRYDSLFLRGDTAKAARLCPEDSRRKALEAALIVLDSRTAGVRAAIGGLRPLRGGYDRTRHAMRSPGSSFKALVYAAAIERGASPADMVEDSPLALRDPDDPDSFWRPHNLEYDYDGRETYRRALYRSRNIPAIRVALAVSLDSVVETARRFGFTAPMRAIPALALGALETNVWEMAAAFRALAGGGVYREPYYVERIRDREGLDMALPGHSTWAAVSPHTAFILCDMLRDVNIRGTAAAVWASGFGFPSAGKTGTTNDNRDAWYVGFSPVYTAALWLGHDGFAALDGHFTGTDAAMPVWLDLMRIIHRGLPREDFQAPSDLGKVSLCRHSGLKASAACDSLAVDWQAPGFAKRSQCRAALH